MDHPENILSSTPTGNEPPISTIPHVTSPIKTPHLRPPPGFTGFTYVPNKHSYIQQPTRNTNLNVRDMTMTRGLEDNLISL